MTRRQCLPWILALGISVASGLAAQTPVQVKDINTTLTGGTWQWPANATFVEMGGTVYFQVSDGIHGTELWRSDGTETGTRLVRDICPGACSSWIVRLTVHGSTLYFGADDGAHGRELWKSDGTEDGTVLVKELVPGLNGSVPSDMFELGGDLYFTASEQATGRELWTTDGTEAGTVLVQDLSAGPSSSSPRFLGRVDSTVFLSAMDAAHGLELWKLSGPLPVLSLVKDIQPGPGHALFDDGADIPGYGSSAVAGSRLYFVADDGVSGQELWASDGTEAGTVLVKDIKPGAQGSSPYSFVKLGDRILFRADDGIFGFELWRCDGTGDTTERVRDISPGNGHSWPWELTVAGNWVYFGANDGIHGRELWKSDGTEANTTLVKDIQPGSEQGLSPFGAIGFASVGTNLLFFADDGTSGMEPWSCDGTEAGTTLLADLHTGSGSSVFPLYGPTFDLRIVVNGRWYFRAMDAGGDIDVYTSDGTPAGTRQLAEINDQASAFEISFLGWSFSLNPLAEVNSALFFQASDGISGQELWKSDGSEAGTEQIADILPGSLGSEPFEITALGEGALFNAQGNLSQGRELWISDGTEAGTGLLKDLDPANSSSGSWPSSLTRIGAQVFFATDTAGGGLWKSDGTEAGTIRVHAVSVSGLTAVGSTLFYSGSGPDGVELWKTDGSPAGTVQVKNIAPGSSSSYPDRIIRAGNRVFFSADDGTSGRELWVSDGTGPGTFRVKDLAVGGGSGILNTWNYTYFYDWAVVGSRVFFVASDGTTGDELWVSDGTEAGTVLVQDIRPGILSSEIEQLTTTDSFVFFSADDGTHGRELWVSDGTQAGTRMLADLIPGEASSLPGQLAKVGRNLVFAAHTPGHGLEPWITDGSLVGTRRLADIAPGATPSSPQSFTLSGASLYFVATDGETGFELYSVPRESVDGGMDFHTVAPCRLFDTRQIHGALEDGTPKPFPVAGSCGVPESVQALAVNVTVLGATSKGNVLLYRAGIEAPGVSTVNFAAGQIRSNNTLVHLGAGAFEVIANLSDGGQVHLIVDVTGYYE